jgi:hypothetical protein
MENTTNNENIVQVEVEEEKPKRPRGRPTLAPEDRKPKNQPKEYFQNYYHKSNLCQVITCPKCNKPITTQKLKRHQLSKRCSEQ